MWFRVCQGLGSAPLSPGWQVEQGRKKITLSKLPLDSKLRTEQHRNGTCMAGTDGVLFPGVSIHPALPCPGAAPCPTPCLGRHQSTLLCCRAQNCKARMPESKRHQREECELCSDNSGTKIQIELTSSYSFPTISISFIHLSMNPLSSTRYHN